MACVDDDTPSSLTLTERGIPPAGQESEEEEEDEAGSGELFPASAASAAVGLARQGRATAS